MNIQCPNCHSGRITTQNRAKKAAGLVGMIGGNTSGGSGAFVGT